MLPLLLLYAKLIGASVIGLAIMLAFKNRSLNETTTASNIQYNGLGELIKSEAKRIIGTLLTITLLFLIFGKAINPDNMEVPDEPISFLDGWVVVSRRYVYEAILVVLFSTIGYTGVDMALRLFSTTRKKILGAIDHKTTKSDIADNVDPHTPTPK